MPKIQDILQNWMLGFWSFLIIAAVIVTFWGLLYLFNQHHRMKPPRARIVIAGCGFIGIIFLWFFLTVLAHFSAELRDMHNASVGRENRGILAGILCAAKSIPQPPPTNYDISSVTSAGMSLSAENKTYGSGADAMFVLRVCNSGPPTTLWDFKSHVILSEQGGGEREIDAIIPSMIIPKTNNALQTIIGPYVPTKENFLLDALSQRPLETGAAGNYWLLVHINGINEIPIGTHVIITFHDAYGRETKIDHMWAAPGT
jgi:hypothetical protein